MKRVPLTRRYGLSVLREMKKRLERSDYPVRQIYLFGSCALDTATADSDIDTAIVCEPFARSKVKEAVAFYSAIRGIDTRIELIVLHPEDLENRYLTVAQEIKRNGIAA